MATVANGIGGGGFRNGEAKTRMGH